MSLRTAIARTATTALLVGATVAGTAGTAQAATATDHGYWASLSVSQRTGAVAYNHATSAASDAAANRKCGASDCRVVVNVTNGCVALAQARNGAWQSAWGGSRAAAERTAISNTAGSGARILVWACTTGHQ
jgi:hypothetical protein